MRPATHRCLVSVLVLAACASLARAERSEIPIHNWSAPPTWTPGSSSRAQSKREASPGFSHPVPFVPLSPCRLADTRGNGFVGAFGAPSMSPGVARNFPAAGNCGIPPNAAAISFNFTVVRTQGIGYLLVYAAGAARPGTSTLNYVAGQIIANSAAVGIGDAGAITVEAAGSQTDLIIDINGYYGGPLVTSLNGMSGDLALAAGENVTLKQSDGLLTLSASSLPGPAGPAGPRGPQGVVGVPGAAGPAGPQGQQGPPVRFRGAWDAAVIYMTGDAVRFNGSSYISLIDGNGGNIPPAPTPLQPKSAVVPWALLAMEGEAGAAGAAGLPGPQGLQGATGDIGPRGPAGRGGYQSFHELGYESGALYLSPLTTWSGATELGNAIARIPTACTMTLISVFVDSPVAGDEVFTLRAGTTMIVTANGWGSDLTDRDLACTIPTEGQTCAAAGSVALTAGQLFDLRVDVGGEGAPKIHDAIVAMVCE